MKRQLGQELLLHHDVAQKEGVTRDSTAAAAARGGGLGGATRQTTLLLVLGASRHHLREIRGERRAKKTPPAKSSGFARGNRGKRVRPKQKKGKHAYICTKERNRRRTHTRDRPPQRDDCLISFRRRGLYTLSKTLLRTPCPSAHDPRLRVRCTLPR